MHNFGSRQRTGLYLLGFKIRNASGEFSSLQITNADDIPGIKITFATDDTGWQEAFASFPQSFLGSVINEQRSSRMVEERDPPFPTFEFVGLGNEHCAFLLLRQDPFQNVMFCA